MTSQSHTPTPWELESELVVVGDAGKRFTATCGLQGSEKDNLESRANAAFIVLAVNNFEEAHQSNKNAETQIKLWRDGVIDPETALKRIGSLVGPYLAKTKVK